METEDVDGACAWEAKGSPAEPKPEPAAMIKRLKLDLSLEPALGIKAEVVRLRVRKNEDRVPMDATDDGASLVQNGDVEFNFDPTAEGQEFQFPPCIPSNFAKFNKNPSISDIMESISVPHYQKSDHLARADICPRIHRPQLVTNKSRLKVLFGYDIGGTTYFWPEETLYLLETGKLEVYCDQVVISAERARCLFLRSNIQEPDPAALIRTCDVDEYTVFKYLAKLGYRLRRPTTELPRSEFLEIDEDEYEQDEELLNETRSEVEEEMEVDSLKPGVSKEGDAIVNFYNLHDLTSQLQGHGTSATVQTRHHRKRRASQPLDRVPEEDEYDSDSSSVVTVSMKEQEECIVEDDSDCEFLEIVENEGKTVPSVGVAIEEDDHMSGCEEEDTMEDEPVAGPSSACRSGPKLPYTVLEADSDSDLEIVDEHIYSHGVSGVYFEELGVDEHEDGHSAESGQAKSGIVDLVSSDSEDEQDNSESYQPIWSQLVPNAKLKMSFPPAYLIPENIPCREDTPTDYDFSNHGDGDTAELDLEKIVDGLHLDSSSSPPPSAKSPAPQVVCASWKEWRQLAMSEARDVLNESLLCSGTLPESRNVMSRLHLWKDRKESGPRSAEQLNLNIPFFLYPPHVASFSKNKLGTEIQPIYQIAIVRNEALIPKLSEIPSRDEDIPVLFAIVSDDCDLLFVTCNSTPLTSLF